MKITTEVEHEGETTEGHIRQEGKKVLNYSKNYYDSSPFTIITWKANADLDKEGHLLALRSFYKGLSDGNFDYEDNKAYDEGLMLIGNGFKKDFGIEFLLNPTYLFKNPSFDDFALLRVNTGYADFGLESREPAWNNKTGRICVMTHQYLENPLLRLIEATNKYEIRNEILSDKLKELYEY